MALSARIARLEAERLRPFDPAPLAYEVGSPESGAHPTTTPRWEHAISGDAVFYVTVRPDPNGWSYTGHLSHDHGHVAPDPDGGWIAYVPHRKTSRHSTREAGMKHVESHQPKDNIRGAM